jgi:hypothetical protein
VDFEWVSPPGRVAVNFCFEGASPSGWVAVDFGFKGLLIQAH